jgi:hypothetical protein
MLSSTSFLFNWAPVQSELDLVIVKRYGHGDLTEGLHQLDDIKGKNFPF